MKLLAAVTYLSLPFVANYKRKHRYRSYLAVCLRPNTVRKLWFSTISIYVKPWFTLDHKWTLPCTPYTHKTEKRRASYGAWNWIGETRQQVTWNRSTDAVKIRYGRMSLNITRQFRCLAMPTHNTIMSAQSSKCSFPCLTNTFTDVVNGRLSPKAEGQFRFSDILTHNRARSTYDYKLTIPCNPRTVPQRLVKFNNGPSTDRCSAIHTFSIAFHKNPTLYKAMNGHFHIVHKPFHKFCWNSI
jgi:hypothetical protein